LRDPRTESLIRVNLRTFGDLTVVFRARYPAGRLRTLETGAIRVCAIRAPLLSYNWITTNSPRRGHAQHPIPI
jgi:hypothetical protein